MSQCRLRSAILFLCPVGDRYIGIDQIANLYIVYDNEYNDEKKGIRGGQGSGSIIRLTHRSNLARRKIRYCTPIPHHGFADVINTIQPI